MKRTLHSATWWLAASVLWLASSTAACSFLRDLDDLDSRWGSPPETDAGGHDDAETPDAPVSDASQDVDAAAPSWWRPTPRTTWQYQLSGEVDTSFDVEMYGIDLFDPPDGVFDDLRADGRVVICYFSAGTFEPWRDDAGGFDPADLGSPLEDYPDERWVDIRSSTVRAVMIGRLDKARDRGCDGVAPANVDAFAHDKVFEITASDQIDYNRFLIEAGHERGLSMGLQNAIGLVKDLVEYVDWVLDAECVGDQLCSLLEPVIEANKAVFHIEYVDDPAQVDDKRQQVCGLAMTEGFSTLIKLPDLGAWRATCEP